MEKELGISGKRQIEEYGVAKFNEACRSIVLRYTKEWRKVITRLGRWVDFDHDYKTMDPDYMESIWWVLSELWKKGLMYEGYYILPYCPRCSTVLSNIELNLGGYIDVADPAITVKFAVEGEPDTYIPRVDHHAVDAAVQPRPCPGRGHRLREGEGRRGALHPGGGQAAGVLQEARRIPGRCAVQGLRACREVATSRSSRSSRA